MIDHPRVKGMDVLQAMFEELRLDLPPLLVFLSDADARTQWLSAMGDVIRAMPTLEQQWASVTLLADEISATRYPGMPLAAVYGWLIREWQLQEMDRVMREQLAKNGEKS